jgi:hypothetical protein
MSKIVLISKVSSVGHSADVEETRKTCYAPDIQEGDTAEIAMSSKIKLDAELLAMFLRRRKNDAWMIGKIEHFLRRQR